MGRLRAWALASPRVLVVEAPGSRPLRWTVEAELDRRGWAQALSPSDADVLLVIGTPGPELAAAVELVWRQIPRPRHRLHVLSEADVEEGLAAAPVELAAAGEQAEEDDGDAAPGGAESGRTAPMDHSGHGAMAGMAMDHSGHEGMDHSGHGAMAGMAMDHSGPEGMDHSGHGAMAGMDHSGHDGMGMDHSGHGAMAGMEHSGHEGMGMDHSGHGAMAGMEHSGHEDMGRDHSGHGAMAGMDHSGHHMHHGGEVAGLPMAETGPDRDGLALDVLRVSLGPILPAWPTGLLLRAELQGDVLTGAQLSWLDAGDHPDADRGADPRRTSLDLLASLLEVAGWSTAARDARWARDGLASPDPGERATAERRAQRVVRRVRRSRALAWSLRGVGCLADPDGDRDGDVLDRMRRWCDAVSDGAASGSRVLALDEVASVLQGAEVAAARLIVASIELQRSVVRAETEIVGA